MKILMVLALVVLAVNAGPAMKWYEIQPALDINKDGGISSEARLAAEWESFKKQYSKAYSVEEEKSRFRRFYKNYVLIEKHNAEEKDGLHTFTMGVNQFADMNNFEFRMMMTGFKSPTNYTQTGSTFLDTTPFGEEDVEEGDERKGNLPSDVDWRTKGYVTPVKNQGKCGSGYSFSTTGSLEGQHYKKTGELISLSEQNIVDCSTDYGNLGCERGFLTDSFIYIQKNKGVDTEATYPYRGYQQTCKFNRENVGATVTGYVELPMGDEGKLQEGVATVGPISVVIDSSHTSFQFYKSGVYVEPDCSSDKLDHAMLAVGYGKEQLAYWLVKNSWGESWGEKGYIRMARNRINQCGIATFPSYPLV